MDAPPKRNPVNTALIVLILLLIGVMALRTYERAMKPERERKAREEQANAVKDLYRGGRVGNEEQFRASLVKVRLTEEQASSIFDSAAYQGQTNIVRLLLDRGWDVKGKKGESALASAACYGFADVIELLLAHGTDPNTGGQRSALGWASSRGHTDSVKLLLDAGADVNLVRRPFQSEYGWTPLMYAAWFGHVNTVKYLLSRGANPRIKSAQGETALMLAKKVEKPVNIKRNPYATDYDPTPERAKQNMKHVVKNSHRIAAIVQMLRAAGAIE